METGIVFNVQRYTVNDGPGIRTEIFLKGCSMHCDWCSNPEGQSLLIEPGVYPSKCLSFEKCGLCAKACRAQALLFGESGIIAIDRDKCQACLECAKACPSEAIKAWGKRMSVDEVMEVVKKDRSFYESSGGGVTISGGDPLVQHEFAKAILKECKKEGIHTCLESTLNFEWDKVSSVTEDADLIISDIKFMDPEKHKRYTGLDNTLVLENIKRVVDLGHDVIIRMPLIPGINDDMENIENTAAYISGDLKNRVKLVQLLSFMRMGEEKCRSLNRNYLMKDLEFDREEFQAHVDDIAKYFNEQGINCIVGTKQK